jgi:hypothetical protein
VDLTPAQLATAARCQEAEGFAQERLVRPQRALHRVQWPGGGVEFHPSHGEWIRILDSNGFVVEALHELYAPADGQTHQYYDIATAQWAMQWPVEDLWGRAPHPLTPNGHAGDGAGRTSRSRPAHRGDGTPEEITLSG